MGWGGLWRVGMTEESLETIHFFVEEHLEGDSGSLVAVVEVTGHPFRFVEGSKEGVELDLLFSSQLHRSGGRGFNGGRR